MSDWRDKAACRHVNPTEGNDPFFPDDGERRSNWDTARAICAGCPISAKSPCLAEALAEEGNKPLDMRDGYRGDTTPAERHRIHLGLPVAKLKPATKPRKERAVPIDQAALTAARVEANNRRKGRETPCPADTPAPTQTTAP